MSGPAPAAAPVPGPSTPEGAGAATPFDVAPAPDPEPEVFLQCGSTIQELPQGPLTDLEEIKGWRNMDASEFKLRVGPNYKKQGKKAPSAHPPLFDVVSMDTYRTTRLIDAVGPLVDIPEPKFKSPIAGVPATIVANIMVPCEGPKMFGGDTKQNTCLLLVVLQMNQTTVDALKNLAKAEPQYRNFVRWAKEAPTDKKIAGRMKLIGTAINWEELSLPSWLKGYNSKPILINKSGSVYTAPRDGGDGDTYLQQSINVYLFSMLARKGLHSLKTKVSMMHFSFGGTIEARSDDEMPERALFAVECFNLPLFEDTHRLTDDAVEWLENEARAQGRYFPPGSEQAKKGKDKKP